MRQADSEEPVKVGEDVDSEWPIEVGDGHVSSSEILHAGIVCSTRIGLQLVAVDHGRLTDSDESDERERP